MGGGGERGRGCPPSPDLREDARQGGKGKRLVHALTAPGPKKGRGGSVPIVQKRPGGREEEKRKETACSPLSSRLIWGGGGKGFAYSCTKGLFPRRRGGGKKEKAMCVFYPPPSVFPEKKKRGGGKETPTLSTTPAGKRRGKEEKGQTPQVHSAFGGEKKGEKGKRPSTHPRYERGGGKEEMQFTLGLFLIGTEGKRKRGGEKRKPFFDTNLREKDTKREKKQRNARYDLSTVRRGEKKKKRGRGGFALGSGG